VSGGPTILWERQIISEPWDEASKMKHMAAVLFDDARLGRTILRQRWGERREQRGEVNLITK
jgi:hypothetical protein